MCWAGSGHFVDIPIEQSYDEDYDIYDVIYLHYDDTYDNYDDICDNHDDICDPLHCVDNSYHQLREFKLHWIEEPTNPDDVLAHQAIAQVVQCVQKGPQLRTWSS